MCLCVCAVLALNFTCQRRSPVSEINSQALSWPGGEPSTASRESDVLTTRPPSHPNKTCSHNIYKTLTHLEELSVGEELESEWRQWRNWCIQYTCTQYSNCPMLTPRVTSSKKLSQCRERVLKRFTKNVFCLRLKMLRVGYLLNCMWQALPSFRPSMGKTAFAKIPPSCKWFITVSPGRSEMDSGWDICSSSNEIRQIRWTIAGMYNVHQDT